MSVGQASAVRAVARANGDNPIAILIPCHRVIGSDGSLTGYGGGLWRKKKLLDLEARTEALRLPGL
jgi:AraC family transcriptional regulator of adaptative response/methylated-DNA-[protein]-cysteine methyltransferase